MFRKQLDQGMAGDNVGLLLRGIDKEAIERGQVLSQNQDQLLRIRLLRLSFMSFQKTKVAAIRHSLTVIALNSSSVLLM